jgi:hypothetical protein
MSTMNKLSCTWPLMITATALLAGPVSAQTAFKLQPGLWEQSMTMKTASGEMEAKMAQMQQQMATMPPAQRKMVEDMMAQRGVGVGGRNNTVKLCVSAEQAARSDVPNPQEGNCQQEVTQRSGSTVRYRFTCTGERPTSGEGEYTMTSPTEYNGRSTVVTQVKGQPEKIEMTHAGRWLGSDCGTIKPLKLNKP